MDKAYAMFGAAQLLPHGVGWAKGPIRLASNQQAVRPRPAVLQRAPFNIHLDVATFTERKGMLDLLPREEELVGIGTPPLAKMIPSYAGSDLKNLCVTAAVSWVGEEETDTTSKRVLKRRHFMLAMKSVRPPGLSRTLKNELQNFETKCVRQELHRKNN